MKLHFIGIAPTGSAVREVEKEIHVGISYSALDNLQDLL
jgi:hypothetical protein